MQLRLAIFAAFFVLTLMFSQPALAASGYPYVGSFGGQGLVKTGAFSFPQYVAVDESGNVYVTDLGNARVQKFDNDGQFLNSWGSKGTGTFEFHAPEGIAVGAGYVYVSDHELNFVKKFDTNGNFISSWGGTGSEAGKFKLPNGVAVSRDNYVYVVDTANARVQKFDSNGKFVQVIGQSGTGNGQFLTPLGIAVDSDGNVFVADTGNNRVQKFNSDGTFVKSFTAASGGLKISPDGVDIDSAGNIILGDSGNNRIVVLDKSGNTVTIFGTTGTGNTQFKMPKGVAVDSDGDLFVVDSSNHRIEKFGSKDSQATAPTTTQQTATPLKPVANDLKKPTVSAPKDLYVEATGGLTRVSIGQAIASDESGIKSITSNAPDEFPLGITTVIWTAIDNAGNMGIATQTITVGDSTPPIISGLKDITIEASGDSNTANLGNPTVNDQVGVLSITNDAPQTFPLGETTVTWTAVDVAGNVGSAIQKVNIVDTTAPVIQKLDELTVEAVSETQNPVTLVTPNATDVQQVTITNNAPAFFPLGKTEITWTAKDTSGNNCTLTQTVSIIDTRAPILVVPANVTQEATAKTGNTVNLGEPTATDATGVSSISNNGPSDYPFGSTIVTWTAADKFDNTVTKTQNVTIIDTTKPTITAPADVTIEATSVSDNEIALDTPKVSDLVEVQSITNDAPAKFTLGQTTITWTVTDTAGNTNTATQTISVVDTTAPAITVPADVTQEATSKDGTIVSIGTAQATDAIGVDSITSDAPSTFGLGTTTIIWTANDTAGNISTATQHVTIIDTTAPIISAPADVTFEATSASDNIIPLTQPTATDVVGDVTVTSDAPESFSLGETIVTWTATDSSGNAANATQKVTVVDTTAPTISAPADITQEATSKSDNTISLQNANATDNVGIASVTNDAPASFPVGETTITWTATDQAGLTSTATQKITIVDTTKPEIRVSDITIEATSEDKNSVDFSNIRADDLVEIASLSSDAPQYFTLGITTVTWTATDEAGNTATATQTITVQDTTAPTITAPSDVIFEATSADANSVSLGQPITADSVSDVAISSDAPESFKLGNTTITWTATDSSGNTATATQTITVQDTTKPTITAPADITIEATSADQNAVTLGDAEATDAVTVSSVENDAPAEFSLGETTVTWTAVDESGNTASATQKVTVVDTTKPTISAPTDITQEATSKSDNTVSLSTPAATDNVGISTISSDAPNSFPVGETVVTWTAKDEAGNVQTVSQKIKIVDTVPPKFSKLTDVTV